MQTFKRFTANLNEFIDLDEEIKLTLNNPLKWMAERGPQDEWSDHAKNYNIEHHKQHVDLHQKKATEHYEKQQFHKDKANSNYNSALSSPTTHLVSMERAAKHMELMHRNFQDGRLHQERADKHKAMVKRLSMIKKRSSEIS